MFHSSTGLLDFFVGLTFRIGKGVPMDVLYLDLRRLSIRSYPGGWAPSLYQIVEDIVLAWKRISYQIKPSEEINESFSC